VVLDLAAGLRARAVLLRAPGSGARVQLVEA
jgi:hypothetical protein